MNTISLCTCGNERVDILCASDEIISVLDVMEGWSVFVLKIMKVDILCVGDNY